MEDDGIRAVPNDRSPRVELAHENGKIVPGRRGWLPTIPTRTTDAVGWQYEWIQNDNNGVHENYVGFDI